MYGKTKKQDDTHNIVSANTIISHMDILNKKMDELNKMMKIVVEDNTHTSSKMEMINDRTKLLSDRMEDIEDIFLEEIKNKKCDDELCSKHKEDMSIFNIGKEENIKDKKTNKGGVVVKVGKLENPLETFLSHLKNTMKKPKEEKVESDSEDEYNPDEPIYEEDSREEINDFVEITKKINNINDIIELGQEYKTEIDLQKSKTGENKKNKMNLLNESDKKFYVLNGKKYGINLEVVLNLITPLKKLNTMIGIQKVKDSVFDMIIYYLQGFENNNSSMLHSIIDGPPGVGKTKFGKILAEIYCALGIIPSKRFKYVKATDLIGDHVGATKHMTQNVIDEADGGVLFIDEAYALSTSETKDPYGKECINTLTFNLAENKKKLIVIIAGYAEDLEKYVFSYNPGLSRRFPFRFVMQGYNADELRDIFIDKMRRNKWKFDKSLTQESLTKFFTQNKDDFPNYGGDIENFLKSCQFSHSRRLIGKNPFLRKKFTLEDIKLGFDKFKSNKRDKGDKIDIGFMYI